MTKTKFKSEFKKHGITMEMYYIFYCENKKKSPLINHPHYNKHILLSTFTKLVNEYYNSLTDNSGKFRILIHKQKVEDYFKSKFNIK